MSSNPHLRTGQEIDALLFLLSITDEEEPSSFKVLVSNCSDFDKSL